MRLALVLLTFVAFAPRAEAQGMFLALMDSVRVKVNDDSGLGGTGLTSYIQTELLRPAEMHATDDGFADVMQVIIADLGSSSKLQGVTIMLHFLRFHMIPGKSEVALVPTWMKSEYIEVPPETTQRAVRAWLRGMFVTFSDERQKSYRLLQQSAESLTKPKK